MRNKSAQKVKLTSFDELFGTEEITTGEKVVSIPIRLFHAFKDHPFRVNDDEKMQEMVESVKKCGILMPGIIRPFSDGEYEVVAGHRRWRACELAGLEEMPVIIREMDDDTATMIMVDTNIQREDILPSEKAHAYRMKYEAMKHQGSKGEKYTADLVGEAAGDSGRTVQRYIRLSELVPELLDYVDSNKLSMTIGEKLSYLRREEQTCLAAVIKELGRFPSKEQAEQLKALSGEEELSETRIYAVFSKKKIVNTGVTISSKKIRNYFPEEYTKEQIEAVIYSLLDKWKDEEDEMQVIEFDYFRGMEAEQYSFYRVPKVLFTSECFKSLSCEAKVLYGLMLDRMSLSIKNRWFDEEDRAYIIFTVDEITELLNCGTQKAVRLIKELDTENGIGLLEKKRLGLGKPNVIYVKNFVLKQAVDVKTGEKQPETPVNTQNCENHNSRVVKTTIQEFPKSQFKNDENHNSGMVKTTIQESRKSQFKNSENHNPGMVKTTIQEFPKSQSNNTDISNTEYSDTESIYPDQINVSEELKTDVIEEMEAYRTVIHDNISYECFTDNSGNRAEQVDELVELIIEVMMMPDDSTIRIGGIEKPIALVKNRFMKLKKEHLEYVLTSLNNNTTKVGNIKAYLLTTLYNAPATIGNYYQAAVNHDLYGGGVDE